MTLHSKNYILRVAMVAVLVLGLGAGLTLISQEQTERETVRQEAPLPPIDLPPLTLPTSPHKATSYADIVQVQLEDDPSRFYTDGWRPPFQTCQDTFENDVARCDRNYERMEAMCEQRKEGCADWYWNYLSGIWQTCYDTAIWNFMDCEIDEDPHTYDDMWYN